MTFRARKNILVFRSNYERNVGHVDDVSHHFGWASHEKFYLTMATWHGFVDSIFPDYFPFNMVQGFLQTVIDYTYDSQAEQHYIRGVDMGRKIVWKVDEVVSWAQNQINTAIDNAKAWIKTNLTDPLDNYINNTLKPQLADAQSRISSMNSQLSGFDTRIQSLVGNLNGLDTRIKDIDSLCDQFNTQINDLTSKASSLDTALKDAKSRLEGLDTAFKDAKSRLEGLDTALKDAQSRLDKYKSLIDALDKRVTALEGKPASTGFQFPEIKFPEIKILGE